MRLCCLKSNQLKKLMSTPVNLTEQLLSGRGGGGGGGVTVVPKLIPVTPVGKKC